MPSCPGVADCFVSRLLSRTELLHAFAKFLHEIFKLEEKSIHFNECSPLTQAAHGFRSPPPRVHPSASPRDSSEVLPLPPPALPVLRREQCAT